MFEKKTKLEVNREELQIIKAALIDFRNDQVRNGEPTNSVNELLAKILKK